MDGRTSAWLGWMMLALGCAGCVTTPPQKQLTTPPNPNSTVAVNNAGEFVKTTPKKEDGPKRTPKAATEVAYGQMKETDSESELAKQDPVVQSRLRNEARQAYQQALKLDPNCLEAYRALGHLYAKMGDYDRAFDTYQKALAKYPKDAALWFDQGMCYNRRSEFNHSIPCFQKALEFAPENTNYLKVYGFTLAYNGHYEQALASLIHAQGLAMAHYNLARVLVYHNRDNEAQQHLQVALRENPQYEQARRLLTELQGPNTAALERPNIVGPQ